MTTRNRLVAGVRTETARADDTAASQSSVSTRASETSRHTVRGSRRPCRGDFRQSIDVPDAEVIPPGPHFVYEDGPSLFLGRRGDGPLDVVWDTNILIDYFEHGNALWEGIPLPDVIAAKYGEELDALQLLVSLWVMRDIRFHVPRRVVDDAKRELSAQNLANRQRALIEFAAALSLASDEELESDDRSGDAQLELPGIADPILERALAALPPGFDSVLVEDALRLGAHVFLTRDGGVLKCRDEFVPLRICIASPQDLLEELAACGALLCLLDQRYAYWPVPDLQRVSHIIAALPPPFDGGT